MVIANSPYIFQQKMNYLFHGFEFTRAYIDDLLILKNGDWKDNQRKLELNCLVHGPRHSSDECKVLGVFGNNYANSDPNKYHGNHPIPRKRLICSYKIMLVSMMWCMIF